MKFLVTVLPKDEVADPQGETILEAARGLGFGEVRSVRAGRAFVIETAAEDEGRVRDLADRLLANPVVESFSVARAS